ncbi:MAG: hypothetical protein JNM56_05790 [Planctomycetia bacterium]|nr:hypothetical protein [Planctomycetia bacterium]
MELMSAASFAGSAFSTIATGYFWMVRARRERPDLRAHLVEREIFLSSGRAETRHLGVKLGIIVANYSLLPNALLGVKLYFKQRDHSWQELQNVRFDQATPLPFNIPTMQTVLLRVNGTLVFPTNKQFEEDNGGNILGGYVDYHLADPREIRCELRHLNGKPCREVMSYSPKAA